MDEMDEMKMKENEMREMDEIYLSYAKNVSDRVALY